MRELTSLEYFVLSLISIEPQSGYSILNYFKSDYWRGKASPGSIYPLLKRLAQQNIIAGKLEMPHEARSRKVYTLTAEGEKLLDNWLKSPIKPEQVSAERYMLMMRFLFAEKRLTREEVIKWLDHYEQAASHHKQLIQLQRNPQLMEWSLHQQLLIESDLMEVETQIKWIQMARERLQKES